MKKLLRIGSCVLAFHLTAAAGLAAAEESFANVRDFGAIGDGTTDDSAALEKAVASKRGIIIVPRGNFRITRPIAIELDKTGYTSFEGHGVGRITMAGKGPALRFIGTHLKGSAEPQTIQENVWQNQRMPRVDGLEIIGADAEADAIEATGTMQLTITATRISQCRHGIHLVRQNRNLIVSNCHIYHNRGIGIYFDHVSLHQTNIVGCHISYCDGGGIVTQGGAIRNIHIGTCDIESNQGEHNEPTANILLDSSEDMGTAEVAITGCTIQHNSKSPNSANIRILSHADDPKKQWGQVTITGNVLSDVKTNVHLEGVRGVTFSANTLWMAYEHALLVEGCRHIVVSGNAFERNPAYDYIHGTEKSKNAILFRNCADCIITGSSIEGGRGAEAGLVLENCNRFNITGCSILDCDNSELLARNLTKSRISGCIIRDDRPGKHPAPLVISGSGNQIVDNLTGE